MGESGDTIWRIDRFVQSLSLLGFDLAATTGLQQGHEPGSPFSFLDLKNNRSYAANYYRQKLESGHMTDFQDLQFRNRISNFVASKADLIFQLKGKEKLRSGIDYNVNGAQEVYSVFASQLLPLETGMQVTSVARRAQIFEILKVGDIILGKVVGKRPFGVFVRILSLVHGRNLDFNNIDIQALCHKSELETDHKSREHLDPIDDFDVDDPVQGVICSISKDEEKIAISFRSSKVPSEYGNIELGIIEDMDEQSLRPKTFDGDLDYNDYLRKDPGFSNPTNIHTLIDVLGIDSRPPNSLLRSSQRWTFRDNEADDLRKQQSRKWSMDTTAIGVESFKSGNHEKALKYFNHALQIYEENSEALVARGALYANQNKLEHAIKDFKQALKLYPKHHNASKYLKETLFEKSLRLKNIGNIREAMNTFEEILKLDPNHIESQEHLKELKSLLSAKLVEEKAKSRQAASLLQENRKKFEHVRKLIKSDPDVAKSSRRKRRKKKKKLKKLTMKKHRRRSESSDKTSTASEAGSDFRDDQWVEKHSKKRLNSPERDEITLSSLSESTTQGGAMQSNISARSGDFSSQSNLFEEEKTTVKDKRFEESSHVHTAAKITRGIEVLIPNLEDTYRAGNLGGGMEEVGERGGGVERSGREKTKGERGDSGLRKRFPSENNGNRLSHNSSPRCRSGSHDESKGLGRRSKTMGKRKDNENNTSESDLSSVDSRSPSRKHLHSRRERSSTRSSVDDSDSNNRHRRTREKRSGEIKSRTKRDVRRSRNSESSDSSERSRSRSSSLKRDTTTTVRGLWRTSRDRERRRRTSRDSRGRRSASRDSRGLQSSSGDSRGLRSASGDSRGRRSASRDSRGRRRASRDRRGRRSANRDSRGRRSASGDSGTRRTGRDSRGRRGASRDSRERRGTRRGSGAQSGYK